MDRLSLSLSPIVSSDSVAASPVGAGAATGAADDELAFAFMVKDGCFFDDALVAAFFFFFDAEEAEAVDALRLPPLSCLFLFFFSTSFPLSNAAALSPSNGSRLIPPPGRGREVEAPSS
jgi:hypothetical protein